MQQNLAFVYSMPVHHFIASFKTKRRTSEVEMHENAIAGPMAEHTRISRTVHIEWLVRFTDCKSLTAYQA